VTIVVLPTLHLIMHGLLNKYLGEPSVKYTTRSTRLEYTRPNYTSGQDDVPIRTEECLCVRSRKPTLGGSGRAARELIVAHSRERPNYTNLLHYMLHYTLGSPSVYAA
jgi:hypothetical protein